jgi:hypothetical protein
MVVMSTVAIALWARGLIKSNRADLIAGCCLFVALPVLGVLSIGSAIVQFLGVALIALAVVTLLAGAFGDKNEILKGTSRPILIIGLILLGTAFLLVV